MTGQEPGSAVLDELRRRRVLTTSELCQRTGLSRHAVSCQIRRANACGFRILNVRGRGGHRDGLYFLASDLGSRDRVCAWSGCGTRLSRSNRTQYCRRHLADLAYLVHLQRLDAVLDELLGTDEQLDLLMAVGG